MKKRILAILCIVTLLATTLFTKMIGPTKSEAQDSITDFTYITLADMEKRDDSDAKWMYESGLKNTIVSLYATLSGEGVRIHVGGSDANSREGFGLIFWGETMEISNAGFLGDSTHQLTYDKVTLQAEDFDMSTFYNQKILFQFQTEILALDADGNENDIRFTIFMNKKKASTITIKDEASKLGNCVRVCDGTYKVAGYKELEKSEEYNYERWTYSDVSGTESVTLNGAVETSTLSGSMNETYFQAKMTFPEGDFGQFFLGTGAYYGILLDNDTSNTNGIRVRIVSTDASQKWGVTLGSLTEDIAGTLRNKKLNLGISVKYFDIQNTQRGKLKIGVWLNGELYNGAYFETEETPLASYTKRVHTQGIKNVEIASVTERREVALPTDFTEYTLADIAPKFTTANASTGDVNGFLPTQDLDKVIYSTWFKGGTVNTQFHYASNSTEYNYAGITVHPVDETTYELLNQQVAIEGFVGGEIYASEALGEGKTFADEFLLQLTTEYVDSDYDGQKDDVKFGVWFNGKLYRGQYYYYTDGVKDLGTRVNAQAGGASFCSYYSAIPEQIENYQTWTYEDVAVVDQKTRDAWNYSITTSPSLDKSLFSGYTKFSNGSRYVLLGTKGGYDGFGFGSNNDGTISFGLFTNSALQKYITIFPEDHGLDSFLGNEVKLGVATHILKVNDDGTLLVEAIPMVNDKLASKRSWIFTFTANQFARNMALVGDFDVRSTDETAPEEAMPTGLTTISLSDLGLDKELNGWQGEGSYEGETLDNTKISFYVNFGDGQGRIHWAKQTTGYSGFAIYRDGENLQVGSDLSTIAGSLYYLIRSAVITPESVGLTTFEDTEIKLDIVTQYIDMDNDGAEDDAKIGLYINNQLATGEYLYAFDATQHLGTGFGVNTASVLTISEEKSKVYTFYDELPSEVKDYSKWTYETVDLPDGVNAYLADWNRTISTGANMDKTMFQGYATFAESGQYVLFGGTKKDYYGYGFKSNADGTISFGLFGESGYTSYITFQPADYNCSTFLGEKVKLSVAIRILSINDDGTLTVEAFPIINDSFAEKRSCSMKIRANRFTRCMALIQAVEVESIAGTAEETMPEGLTEIKLEDFGLENELACWQGDGTYKGASLDDTVMSFRVNFGDGQGRIHWAKQTTGYSGFALYRDGDNLVMGSDLSTVADSLYYLIGSSVITPESVGLTNFENVELEVSLVTQYLDLDYDGNDDDVKIGVYIEGKLANGIYMYAIDAVDHLGLGFGVNTANVYTIASSEVNIKTVPTNLKNITLSDARIGIGSGNIAGKFLTLKSLDGTLFSAKVKFNQNGSRMHLGLNNKSDNNYSGIGVRLEGDKLVIGNELGDDKVALNNMGISHIVISPKQVGVGDTFVDKEFLLQMSIEFVDCDGNGKKDDIKLGVMINGKFFANTYFYIKDQASKLGTKINFNEGGAASYAPYGDVYPEIKEKTYQELTARDFMLSDRAYKDTSVYNIYDYDSLGGKSFVSNVTFSKENAGEYALYLGGSAWSGLRTEVRTNGCLRISHIHTDGTQTILAEIEPKEVGMKTFFGKKFKLAYTFDVVKGEKGYVNYRLGVFINGKLYKNDYLWAKHVEAETLTESIFVYTQGGGTISMESVNNSVDFSIWGVTKYNWKSVLN